MTDPLISISDDVSLKPPLGRLPGVAEGRQGGSVPAVEGTSQVERASAFWGAGTGLEVRALAGAFTPGKARP